MAIGLAELIILGLFVDFIMRRIKIPGLIGMLGIGIALGPCVFAILKPDLLGVSTDLRMIALIVILLRAGTYLCLIRSSYTFKERIFIIISYLPKATVQAAIGGAPLLAMQAAGMNTRAGEIILAIAVLSILLTAPAGAWAISFAGNRILKTQKSFLKDEVEKKKVSETDNIEKVIEAFSQSDHINCPVVDKYKHIIGIINLNDLRSILLHRKMWKILIAGDALKKIDAIIPFNSTLFEARKIMKKDQLTEIPVVEKNKLVGIINLNKIERFVQEQLLHLYESSS